MQEKKQVAATRFGPFEWQKSEAFIVRDAKRNLPDTYNIYTSWRDNMLFLFYLVNIFA